MKTFIKTSLTCIVAGLAYSSYAQDSAPLIRYYEAEGKTYYEVYQCVPGSDLAFYSEQQGGYLLQSNTTDANGHLLLEAKDGFSPAFALSVKGGTSVPGSGKVTFISDKDFQLNDLRLIEGIDHNYITWRAAVAEPDQYIFTVLKSSDGVHYTAIGTIDVREKTASTYSFSDQQKGGVSYKVEISNKLDHLGYVSKPLSLNTENNNNFPDANGNSLKNALNDANISIYPNPFNDVAQVKIVASAAGQAIISVMDISGRLILSQEATFTAGTNLVALNGEETLDAGVYLLQTEIDGVVSTQKIIKQ